MYGWMDTDGPTYLVCRTYLCISAEAPRPWYMAAFGDPITFTSVACRRPCGNQANPPVKDQLTKDRGLSKRNMKESTKPR